MELGNFSVSLAVKDLAASKAFYEKLGFAVFGGDQSQGWLILKNGAHNIGLFQGMFDKNILTFNPGWTSDAQPLSKFTDVRELQRQLKASGVTMIVEADESSTGPGSFMIADPDGNTICTDMGIPLGLRQVVSSHPLTADGSIIIEVMRLGGRRSPMLRIRRANTGDGNALAALLPHQQLLRVFLRTHASRSAVSSRPAAWRCLNSSSVWRMPSTSGVRGMGPRSRCKAESSRS